MMNDNKVDPQLIAYAEKLLADAWTATPGLSKRGINLDHLQVKELLESAMMYAVLCQIRDELRFMNHEKRIANLPLSMFNPNNNQTS